MQFKDTIEKMFGEATVERQETWKTFGIGPIPKTIRGLDGVHSTMEGPLQEELAFVRDIVPIRYMGWTRRSQNEEPYGYIRICVPESRADKFPSRLRIFGEEYLFKGSAHEVKLPYARSALAFMLLDYVLDQRNVGLVALMHITVHVNRGLGV